MRRTDQMKTYVSLTELKAKTAKVLKETGKNYVIVEKHHKPVAVLMSLKEFQFAEDAMDELEDEYFGKIVKERMKHPGKGIPIEEVMKKYGIKK